MVRSRAKWHNLRKEKMMSNKELQQLACAAHRTARNACCDGGVYLRCGEEVVAEIAGVLLQKVFENYSSNEVEKALLQIS